MDTDKDSYKGLGAGGKVTVEWARVSVWGYEKFWRLKHLKVVKWENFMLCIFYHSKKIYFCFKIF